LFSKIFLLWSLNAIVFTGFCRLPCICSIYGMNEFWSSSVTIMNNVWCFFPPSYRSLWWLSV
jgi:hypothetical protein